MSKTEKSIDWIKENRVYFFPLIIPLLGYYLLQFLVDLLIFMQVLAMVAVLVSGVALFMGIWFAIMIPEKSEGFMNRRIARVIAPLRWGYDLTVWLMEEHDWEFIEGEDEE